jgi:hypothetical protein
MAGTAHHSGIIPSSAGWANSRERGPLRGTCTASVSHLSEFEYICALSTSVACPWAYFGFELLVTIAIGPVGAYSALWPIQPTGAGGDNGSEKR